MNSVPPLPRPARRRRRAVVNCWLLALVLIGTRSSVGAQGVEKESAAPALARAVVEALGGEEGYRKSADARLRVRATTPTGQGGNRIEMEMVLHTRSDGKRRLEKRVQGEKQILGSDGKDFWMTLPDGQVAAMPQTVADAVRLDVVQQLIFLEYDKHGYAVQDGGEISEDGQALRRLTFLRKGAKEGEEKPGDRLEFHIDSASKLPVRLQTRYPDPWGGKSYSLTIHFEDYRLVGGVPIPHRTRQFRDGSEILSLEILEVEIGKRFADSIFRHPNPAD